MNIAYKPAIVGIIMGLMMLWLLHGQLTTGSAVSVAALAAFVGIHVVLAIIALNVGVFAARISPRLRMWLSRQHRPSATHIVWMLGSAALTAFCVHIVVHGALF